MHGEDWTIVIDRAYIMIIWRKIVEGLVTSVKVNISAELSLLYDMGYKFQEEH